MEDNFTNVEVFKCKNCAADMTFDPKSGNMVCAHCGSTLAIEADRNLEQKPVDFSLDAGSNWVSETKTFRCDNCGATTTFDKAEFASECAYCGSKKVLSLDNFEGIKPGALLPFVLSAAEACAAWLKWLKKKLFAPRKIKRDATLDRIKGVYSPCWTFDADTFSNYNGIAGRYYYVTVGSGNNRRQERRVSYFPVRGSHSKSFQNVMVDASPHISSKDMTKIRPFPMQNAVAYDKRYLSGFSADRYNKTLQDGWKDGEKIMKNDIYNEVKRSIKADVIQTLNVYTQFNNPTFKHLLLPVYVSRATFKEKVYNFFINGINGKVSGKTPVSAVKVLITVGICLAAAVGIGLGLYFGFIRK